MQRSPISVTLLALLSLLALLAEVNVVAGDWPQWRGPARDGVLSDFVPPTVWPKQLEQRWKIDVGIGFSSPVVSGDTIFVFTRQDENEVVRAVSLASGKELWSTRYPAPYEMNTYARSMGKGLKSTPVVADGRLVTFGISGIAPEDGALLWTLPYKTQYEQTLLLLRTL
jgi:outer membrane protein assembly factor BamB